MNNVYSDMVIRNLPEPYIEMNFYNRRSKFKMVAHSHPYYQVIFMIDKVLCFKHSAEEFILRKGDICIAPPLYIHSLESVDGYQQLGINLNDEENGKGIISLLSTYINDLIILNKPDIFNVLPILERESNNLSKISKQKISNIWDNILIDCVETISRGEKAIFKDDLLKLLNKNLSNGISLSKISKELAISQTQLERLTNKEFGCGVVDLYNQLRINKACSLLVNSSLTIKQIAESLGFCDQAYFSNFFKKKVNLSPTDYRKQKRAIS